MPSDNSRKRSTKPAHPQPQPQPSGSEHFIHKQRNKLFKEPILNWIMLFNIIEIIGFCVLVPFLIFELIGNNPIFISSYIWTLISGSFGGYLMALTLWEISINNYYKLDATDKLKIQKIILSHVFASLWFIIIFVFNYYVYQLNKVTNSIEYDTDRNITAVLFLIVILESTKSFISALYAL
jgi:uncharacterized membrane protein